MKQIIALGGGGFLMEPEHLVLDEYILKQTGKARPAVCFLPQASADSPIAVSNFYRAFTSLDTVPSWLSLFGTVKPGWQDHLLAQDVIYVGGGNTRSMLALWREWGVDQVLRQAYEAGVILAGVSAGAICWFEQGLTDSVWPLGALPCLGFLKGSASPHYDGEAQRRPRYHALMEAGQIKPGIALNDYAGAHFIDDELHQIVTSHETAVAFSVSKDDSGQIIEVPYPTTFLG